MSSTGGSPPQPTVQAVAAAPFISWEQSGGYDAALKRVISREAHGSDIVFGIAWMNPGQETRWSFEGDDRTADGEVFYGSIRGRLIEEVFYVTQGRLHLAWNEGDPDEGHLEAGPGEAIFLPSGWRYHLSVIEPVSWAYFGTPAWV